MHLQSADGRLADKAAVLRMGPRREPRATPGAADSAVLTWNGPQACQSLTDGLERLGAAIEPVPAAMAVKIMQ